MPGIQDRKMFRNATPMAAGGLMIQALEQAGAVQPVMEQLGITNLAGAVPGPNMAALFMQMYGRAPSPEELQSFMAQNPVGMAEGGATFPDLSGDGKVTQKDILMGRGVSMANGGMVPPMEGYMPPMEENTMADMPLMSPEQEAQIYQEAQNLPPEVIQMAGSELDAVGSELAAEGVGAAVDEEVSRSINNMDMAGDFKDIMNSVWDENEGLETYRSRLAEVVGPEDAQRTPDSVLALVQPTLQLAQIDQGIGALMQEELAEVGGMDGGITELATKSAVADGMAAETGALVNAVGNMAQGPSGIAATGTDPMGMDPMMVEAMMQGAGPMGQGMV
jgi:hypothetical protein